MKGPTSGWGPSPRACPARSSARELSALDGCDERRPRNRLEDERRAEPVLAVPDGDYSGEVGRDLHAVTVVQAAVAALAPLGSVELGKSSHP